MPLHTTSPTAPRFQMLTKEAVERTHRAVLEVLWEIGLDFPHERALFRKSRRLGTGRRANDERPHDR
ncbi:MAG: hypothetical protein ACOYZ7_13935 [Chloroflexota bacterium]